MSFLFKGKSVLVSPPSAVSARDELQNVFEWRKTLVQTSIDDINAQGGGITVITNQLLKRKSDLEAAITSLAALDPHKKSAMWVGIDNVISTFLKSNKFSDVEDIQKKYSSHIEVAKKSIIKESNRRKSLVETQWTSIQGVTPGSGIKPRAASLPLMTKPTTKTQSFPIPIVMNAEQQKLADQAQQAIWKLEDIVENFNESGSKISGEKEVLEKFRKDLRNIFNDKPSAFTEIQEVCETALQNDKLASSTKEMIRKTLKAYNLIPTPHQPQFFAPESRVSSSSSMTSGSNQVTEQVFLSTGSMTLGFGSVSPKSSVSDESDSNGTELTTFSSNQSK